MSDTGGKMRVFYPICQVAELAARYRYTTQLLNEQDQRIYHKRLPNDLATIVEQ